MRICYSELCLLGGRIEDNVARLAAAGAEYVELMLDGAGWDEFHLHKEEIAARLRSNALRYSVHVPVWGSNLAFENAEYREAVLESYRQSIAFAALVEARHVVIHPGTCPHPRFSKETARRRSKEALLSLLEYSEPFGLDLLLENVGTTATSIFTESEFSRFLDGLPAEAGYLVDVGHAHICGWNLDSLLPALGGRLKALHLHDNDGVRDSHGPIGSGTIDWVRTLSAAVGTGRDLDLVLEYDIGTELTRLTEGKARLEATLARESASAT